MFTYCGNNPVQHSDSNGNKHVPNCRADYLGVKEDDWADLVYDIIETYQNTSIPNVAGSYGKYVSVTLGAFNVSATFETAVDLHGNVQYNSSFSFDITTSGSFSISKGYTGSIFFVPDVSYLAGDAYYLGGGATVPIPAFPLAATGSVNVGQTSDGYMGLMFSAGIAPATSAGAEVHGGYSSTHSWTPAINILDLFQYILR